MKKTGHIWGCKIEISIGPSTKHAERALVTCCWLVHSLSRKNKGFVSHDPYAVPNKDPHDASICLVSLQGS